MKIKTIDVNAKEWFDKVNGNSYFSANVIINYGMPEMKEINLPFQYGYGDHYRDVAFKTLQENGYICEIDEHVSHWQYYRNNNIIVRHSKQENCKKRDLTWESIGIRYILMNVLFVLGERPLKWDNIVAGLYFGRIEITI